MHDNLTNCDRAHDGRPPTSKIPPATSYLLDWFPSELRDEIWELALHDPEGISPSYLSGKQIKVNIDLTLTLMCKRIRRECVFKILHLNELHFVVPDWETYGKARNCLLSTLQAMTTSLGATRPVVRLHIQLGTLLPCQITRPCVPEAWMVNVSWIIARVRQYTSQIRLSFKLWLVLDNLPIDIMITCPNETWKALCACIEPRMGSLDAAEKSRHFESLKKWVQSIGRGSEFESLESVE
jgi:hypothetical protein